MGRTAKTCGVLLALILLTGCNKPGEIDPNLHYIDVNTPGVIPGQTEEAIKHDGSDNWGVNPDDYGDLSDPDNYNRYINDYYEAQADYYRNLPGYTGEAFSTEEETIEEEQVVPKPTFNEISSYTDDELLKAYGDADAYGFYDFQKHNICSRTGQLVEKLNITYEEAVQQFTELLGFSDAEFIYADRKETYWFESNTVYSVASSLNDQLVQKSQSPYITDFTIDAQLYELGTPYHEDYYHIIWKSGNSYTCMNRFTKTVSYSEV